LIEPLLFEARYAIALWEAGVKAEYEYPTVGGSSVDFMLPATHGPLSWLVELVSIRESDHVRAATVTASIAPGIVGEEIDLRGDDENVRATPAAELIRVIEKVGEKVYDVKTRTSTKFPEPNESSIHVILVDMRGFEGIGDPDEAHLRQIAYGSDDPRVPDDYKEYDPQTQKPIIGLFHPANKRPAGVLARSRIHYLGFVSEKTYASGEINDRCQFFKNDHLLPISVFDQYPLRRSSE
jgi:hypothetical protein